MSSTGRINFFFAGILLFFHLLSIPTVAFAQQVTLKVLKDSYAPGEKISILVTNPTDENIFTVAASARPGMALTNIEKKAAVGWDALPLRCRQPSCDVDYVMPEPEQIKPGKSVAFSWEPKILSDNKYVRPEPGIYRLTIMYQVRKAGRARAWNWTTVRSNTFTLE
ncbi:MAG: hypothetical protein WCY10_06820 [Candidatus Omnitrophota bacterium]